jgi:hypothetical protein
MPYELPNKVRQPEHRDHPCSPANNAPLATRGKTVDDLTDLLRSVDWDSYHHPCGFDQREIPELIVRLAGQDQLSALEAAKRLWNVVAHQGNVGPSSVAITPFLIERTTSAPPGVQEEILDILYQFTCAAVRVEWEGLPDRGKRNWAGELWSALNVGRSRFEELARCPDERVATFAQMILEQLRKAKYSTTYSGH